MLPIYKLNASGLWAGLNLKENGFDVRKEILGQLRRIGYCEGISFLLLLGVAMPLKYGMGIKSPTLIIGSLHGLLFILYVIVLARARTILNWTPGRLRCGLLASVLPFGPFVFDARLRKDETV